MLVKPLCRGGGFTLGRASGRALPGERDLWSHTRWATASSSSPSSPREEMEVGRAIFDMPGALCYLAATAESRPNPRAGAPLAVARWPSRAVFRQHHSRLAPPGPAPRADCRPPQRRSGPGCDLATASTLPGSASQRNYERWAFKSHTPRPRWCGSGPGLIEGGFPREPLCRNSADGGVQLVSRHCPSRRMPARAGIAAWAAHSPPVRRSFPLAGHWARAARPPRRVTPRAGATSSHRDYTNIL